MRGVYNVIKDLINFNFPVYFYCIALAYYLFAFICTAVVFNKVAIAEKFDKPYFALIPILNLYVLFKLGKTKPILLLSILGLIFPKLWIFFFVAFQVIVANCIGDVLRKFGVGSLLIYVGVIVPFLWMIPLKELYIKAGFNIQSNITIREEVEYSRD